MLLWQASAFIVVCWQQKHAVSAVQMSAERILIKKQGFVGLACWEKE